MSPTFLVIRGPQSYAWKACYNVPGSRIPLQLICLTLFSPGLPPAETSWVGLGSPTCVSRLPLFPSRDKYPPAHPRGRRDGSGPGSAEQRGGLEGQRGVSVAQRAPFSRALHSPLRSLSWP